jgi:hypothetical protein
MRLQGWCTGCKRFRVVRVNSHGMAMLAVRHVAEGICDECERREDEERRARYASRSHR